MEPAGIDFYAAAEYAEDGDNRHDDDKDDSKYNAENRFHYLFVSEQPDGNLLSAAATVALITASPCLAVSCFHNLPSRSGGKR